MASTTIDRNLSYTARKLGVSLGALLKANPQLSNPNLIRSGTKLRVPGRRSVSKRENARQMARVFATPSSVRAPAASSVSATADSRRPTATYGSPDVRFRSSSAGLALQLGRPSSAGLDLQIASAPRVSPAASFDPRQLQRGRGIGVSRGDQARNILQRLAETPPAAGPRSYQAATSFLRGVPQTIYQAGQAVGRYAGRQVQAAGAGYGQLAQFGQRAAGTIAFGDPLFDAGAVPGVVRAGQEAVQLGQQAAAYVAFGDPFTGIKDKAPNTLRPSAVDDDPIVTTELIRNADGTVTRKPMTRSQMEERMSTPQDVVLSQSINGRTYNLTASDIAYGARMTGQALFEFRKQEDPSLRPGIVSNVSAYNLLGMGETLTGTPVSSVEDMMTKLGYTLVGDFWVVNDPYTTQVTYGSPSLPGERGIGGGGGGGERRISRGPSGFGRSPSNLYNWHIRITI